MYTICFRTIYSSTQVLAIKLRYSEIVLKFFLELNSCMGDSGGGGGDIIGAMYNYYVFFCVLFLWLHMLRTRLSCNPMV